MFTEPSHPDILTGVYDHISVEALQHTDTCPKCGNQDRDELNYRACSHCDEGTVREQIDCGVGFWESTACWECAGTGHVIECDICGFVFVPGDEEEGDEEAAQ